MEYNNNSIKISYSIYEIMLFATIWTYGLFGAFITRSDSYIVLIFSSLISILLCYLSAALAISMEYLARGSL